MFVNTYSYGIFEHLRSNGHKNYFKIVINVKMQPDSKLEERPIEIYVCWHLTLLNKSRILIN